MSANIGVLVLVPQPNVTFIENSSATDVFVKSVATHAGPSYIASIYIKSLKTVSLVANCDAIDSIVELIDSNGSSLGLVTGSTPTPLGDLIADRDYFLRYESGATAIVAGAAIVRLSISEDVINSSFFANGFVPVVSPTSSLSYAFNSYGGLTFTFVSYPLTIGQVVPLATASNALQSGTLNITSSDVTTFSNLALPFVAEQFLNLSVVANKTTIFSGTVYFNCSTAGTSVALAAVPVAAPA